MEKEETDSRIEKWLQGNYDSQTKEEILSLKKTNPEKLIDAFYTTLKFGTGGMRGLMGPGTNRVNSYTVRGAALGIARYLKKTYKNSQPLSIVVGYDSRLHSQSFAEEFARVLAEEKIKVYLFKELRPVPLVSFSVRYKKATAGIMVTASHNPPLYNGIKVYGEDGGQVLPPHDKGIVDEVNKISDFDEIKLAPLNHPLIQHLGDEMDEAYLEEIYKLQSCTLENQESGDKLKIIYTPLHGAGITMIPKALAMWGFIDLHVVKAQENPDGHFPTVVAPNPEIPSTLSLGIDELIEKKADLLLATDADTDRVGCVVNHKGTITILDGNEIAVLLAEHLCSAQAANNNLKATDTLIKSIVTTDMLKAIAKKWNIHCLEVLPGFKYIGQLMTEEEKTKKETFLFGAEESFGYLAGTYARDKDAIISCTLLAEAALKAKLEGKTLVDRLKECYAKYGVYRNHLHSIDFPETKQGRELMKESTKRLREKPPLTLLGAKLLVIDDYLKKESLDLATGKRETITLPTSDILILHYEGGVKLTCRPSGTEPKIKLYIEVRDDKNSPVDLGIEHSDTLAKEYLSTFSLLLAR